MRADRGELLNRLSGIGNTVLFIVVLLGLLYLGFTGQYAACGCAIGVCIYAELWNLRVSVKNGTPPEL